MVGFEKTCSAARHFSTKLETVVVDSRGFLFLSFPLRRKLWWSRKGELVGLRVVSFPSVMPPHAS